jgi:hypothetical protein
MGLPTSATDWPSNVDIPTPVKKVIDLFFTLADDKSADAGDRLADEIFTIDAIQQMNSRRVEGGARTYTYHSYSAHCSEVDLAVI